MSSIGPTIKKWEPKIHGQLLVAAPLNYFHGWGGIPLPFAENSAKIINLIFEPFPNECLPESCPNILKYNFNGPKYISYHNRKAYFDNYLLLH